MGQPCLYVSPVPGAPGSDRNVTDLVDDYAMGWRLLHVSSNLDARLPSHVRGRIGRTDSAHLNGTGGKTEQCREKNEREYAPSDVLFCCADRRESREYQIADHNGTAAPKGDEQRAAIVAKRHFYSPGNRIPKHPGHPFAARHGAASTAQTPVYALNLTLQLSLHL